MARELKVEIIGDASSYNRALNDASGRSSRFGSALGSVAKAGALAAGAAGVGALFITLRQGITEFTESTKVAAQTAAVLKSTGSVANVSAKQVDALADSLLRKTGIDDEAIKSGENLLLTFRGIRNETGKGNDIFNQATVAITDMSVALGKDLNSSAIQLGKALNDPVRGLTALRRVGVAFTADQQNLIKSLVASGNTLDAQKVILKELRAEFGGSAEAAGKTLPGQLNVLRETFNNLAGDLISKAVPAVTSFVTFLNDKGIPVISEAFGKIGEIAGPAIANLGKAFDAAAPAILGVLEPLGAVIRDNLVPVFIQLQDIVTRAMAAISQIIKDNGPQLRQIFENLGTVISNLAKVVVPLLDFAFTKLLPVAIRILIPILQLVTEAMAKISTATRIVANVIEAVMIPAMNFVITVGTKVVTFLTKTLVTAFNAVVGPIKEISGVLRAVLGGAFDSVAKAAQGVQDIFEWFANKAAPIWAKLGRVLPVAIDAITAPLRSLLGVLQAIVNAMRSFLDKAGEVISVAGKVAGTVGGILGHIPGRALGGPVSQGQAYIVGERGPELFVPGMSGSIVPNTSAPSRAATGAGSWGGVTVNVYGDVTGDELVRKVREGLLRIDLYNPGSAIARA